MHTRETRAAAEVRASGMQLTGYAAVFDSPSDDLGGFIEYVRRGAFRRSLEGNRADPLALIHHMPHMVLGRRSAGTLRLAEDTHGLHFEIDLPNTTTARDLAVSVERGDVKGASFAFAVAKDGDRWSTDSGKAVRELLEVDLFEITITPVPAYPDTEVARRALATCKPSPRVVAARRWLEAL